MKSKYSILLASGEIQTIQARNMSEVANEYPDALKIESIDAISLKARLKKLNSELASLSYLASSEIGFFFRNCLEGNGFPVPMEISEIGSGAQGELRAIDIGGAFLCVTWYRMPSGKFEIVSYAN